MPDYRTSAAEHLADVARQVAELTVLVGFPADALSEGEYPVAVVRVVDDEVVDDERMINRGGFADVTLTLTVLSAASETDVNRLLSKVADLVDDDYDYDGFEVGEPDLEGEDPVFSGTATYIRRVRR